MIILVFIGISHISLFFIEKNTVTEKNPLSHQRGPKWIYMQIESTINLEILLHVVFC